MRKNKFIEEVQKMLGSDVDPLELKRKLEDGNGIVDGLGSMGYDETFIFLQNFEVAERALKGVTLSNSVEGTGLYGYHKSSEYSGVKIAIHGRTSNDMGGYSRGMENYVLSKVGGSGKERK